MSNSNKMINSVTKANLSNSNNAHLNNLILSTSTTMSNAPKMLSSPTTMSKLNNTFNSNIPNSHKTYNNANNSPRVNLMFLLNSSLDQIIIMVPKASYYQMPMRRRKSKSSPTSSKVRMWIHSSPRDQGLNQEW